MTFQRLAACTALVLCTWITSTMAMTAPGNLTASASTRFGLALLRKLTQGKAPQNVFISPLSIHSCLEMGYNGASGKTAEEMAKVLQLSASDLSAVNNDYVNFIASLKALPEGLHYTDPAAAALKLEIANSLWGNKNVRFKPEFVKILKTTFGADCESLDFGNPQSVTQINSWVKDKTHGKINSIVTKLSPLDMLVLLNSAYFKGRWEDEFNKKSTKPSDFHLVAGGTKKVPMMHLNSHLDYLEDGNLQAVRLPYTDNRFGMYIFLPKNNLGLAKFCQMLTADNWALWNRGFSSRLGELAMPKYKMQYSLSLKEALRQMGMEKAFSASADFSRMVTPPPMPFVGDVVHKTYVDVNEEGTEAAAVTAMIMPAAKAPAPPETPFKMIVDRPFFFAVVHEENKTILFAGTVASPE